MDTLTLSEQERRWYWELFRLLDVDGSDQLPGAQTFDMFMTSGLHSDIVNQVKWHDPCNSTFVDCYEQAKGKVRVAKVRAGIMRVEVRAKHAST